MYDRNTCTLIHPGPPGTRRAPLFLLHDGGGTIFNYFLLKPLNRPVYGIANPRTAPGQDWEGGLHQMAAEYLPMIKEATQGRPVMLGGWSLGGLVALEISHIELSQQKQHASSNANLQILGLVLIDSVFPHPMDVPPTVESVNYEAEFEDHVTPETRAVVQYAMEQTDRLIEEWQPPSWEAEQPTPARGDTGAMPSGAPKATNTLTPPPAMLLRAREPVPPPPQTKPGIKRVIDVDLTRERRFLGWEDYKTKFIRNVLDVNGHHHNIFKDHNITSVDAKLKIACRSLDPGH